MESAVFLFSFSGCSSPRPMNQAHSGPSDLALTLRGLFFLLAGAKMHRALGIRRLLASAAAPRTTMRALATTTAPGSDHSSSSSSSSRRGLLGLAAGAVLAATAMGPDREAKACGIVGVVGADDARSVLLEGLTVLQVRTPPRR